MNHWGQERVKIQICDRSYKGSQFLLRLYERASEAFHRSLGMYDDDVIFLYHQKPLQSSNSAVFHWTTRQLFWVLA